MSESTICPRKITFLKQKIIQVGELLQQCNKYKEISAEISLNNARNLEKLKSVSQQYLLLLTENQNLNQTVNGLKNELEQSQSAISQSQLEIVQLQQVIDVYKLERAEYGREKVEALEKKLKMAVSEHLYLCENLKRPGFVFKSVSNKFKTQLEKEIGKVYGKHLTLPSPAPSSESGFESMINSPVSTIEEETPVFEKNDGKSMPGNNFLHFSDCGPQESVSNIQAHSEIIEETGSTEMEEAVVQVEPAFSALEENRIEDFRMENQELFPGEQETLPVIKKSVFEPEIESVCDIPAQPEISKETRSIGMEEAVVEVEPAFSALKENRIEDFHMENQDLFPGEQETLPLTKKSVFEPEIESVCDIPEILEETGSTGTEEAVGEVDQAFLAFEANLMEDLNIENKGSESVQEPFTSIKEPESVPVKKKSVFEPGNLKNKTQKRQISKNGRDSKNNMDDMINDLIDPPLLISEKVLPIDKTLQETPKVHDGNQSSDEEISDQEIAKIFESMKLPPLLSPLPLRKKIKSKQKPNTCKKNSDVATQVERCTGEFSTQTENTPLDEKAFNLKDSEMVMFKHFKMFIKWSKMQKRRRPKVGQWVIENVKKKNSIDKKNTKKLIKKTRKFSKKSSDDETPVFQKPSVAENLEPVVPQHQTNLNEQVHEKEERNSGVSFNKELGPLIVPADVGQEKLTMEAWSTCNESVDEDDDEPLINKVLGGKIQAAETDDNVSRLSKEQFDENEEIDSWVSTQITAEEQIEKFIGSQKLLESSETEVEEPLIKTPPSLHVNSPTYRKSPRLAQRAESSTKVFNNPNSNKKDCISKSKESLDRSKSSSPGKLSEISDTRRSKRLSAKKPSNKRTLLQLFDSSSEEELETMENASPKSRRKLDTSYSFKEDEPVVKKPNFGPANSNVDPPKIPRLPNTESIPLKMNGVQISEHLPQVLMKTNTIQIQGASKVIESPGEVRALPCQSSMQEQNLFYTSNGPQAIVRPFTRSQKPVPIGKISHQVVKSGDEAWIDYKIKPTRKSLLSFENTPLPTPAPAVNKNGTAFNFEDMWERSKMLKMKPCVLSQQGAIEKLPPKPTQLQPQLPVCYVQEQKVSVKTTGNFFTDIIANMDKPPVVPCAVNNIAPKPCQRGKNKKSKKKKKKKQQLAQETEILPPSFKNKHEETAWKSLDQFLTAQNATNEAATQSLQNCIAALNEVGDNILVKTVVNLVLENVNESPDLRFTPPAPPLTPTQHRLFALLASCERFKNLYDDIIDNVCSVLLPETFIWPDDSIESCAMFLGALYRHTDDSVGAVSFCVKVAAGMRQRGSLVINSILSAWPEILPLAQNADPWGPGATISMLIMSTPIPIRENQKSSLIKLKNLLNLYYGYEREVVMADWTKKAIEALRKGDMAASRALAAVAPICAESLIIPPLMESLGVWEFGGIPDNVAFKMLDVLTLSLKACAKSNKNKSFCKETVQRIGEILHAGKVSRTGQEEIVKLISSLSNYSNKYHLIFDKWMPNEPVTPKVRNLMVGAILRSQSKPNKKKKKKQD